MSIRKKFTKEEAKGVGLRIRACRILTGLTQEMFGSKFEIPSPSIKTWEFGSVIPRSEGLNKFISSLRSVGIFVSIDWLLYGSGTGPAYLLSEVLDGYSNQDNFSSNEEKEFENNFKKSCQKNKENPVIIEVNNDDMAPLFRKGDLIAGVLLDKASFNCLHDTPMLVKQVGDKFAPRFIYSVDSEFFIRSLSDPGIKKIALDSVGVIRWHKSC